MEGDSVAFFAATIAFPEPGGYRDFDQSQEVIDPLVIGGSPASGTEDRLWVFSELDIVEQADQRQMPVLGVCFGAQLLARAYYDRAAVRKSSPVEIG